MGLIRHYYYRIFGLDSGYLKTLPDHIIESIIRYIYNSSRLYYSHGLLDKSADMSEYNVCRKWRQVYTDIKSNDCTISIMQDNCLLSSCGVSWQPHQMPCFPFEYDYVKSCCICLLNDSIFDGSAAKALTQKFSHLPSGKLSLIRAQKLVLNSYIMFLDEEDIDINMAEQNIVEFVTTLQKMLPRLAEVEIQYQNQVLRTSEVKGVLNQLLATHLYGLTRKIIWTAPQFLPEFTAQLEIQQPLAKFECVVSGGFEWFLNAIHSSASSLVTLDLEFKTDANLVNLVVDQYGLPVIYSNLKTFKIKQHQKPWYGKRLLGHVYAPFPNLQVLVVRGRYPYKNDLLFQGNSSTLNRLYMKVDQDSLDMLLENGVFSKTEYSNLEYVKLIWDYKTHDVAPSNLPEALELLLTMSPAVHTLESNILDAESSLLLSSAITVASCLDKLQVVILDKVTLTFNEFIKTVKAMPMLTDVHCKVVYVDDPFTDLNVFLHDLSEGKCKEYVSFGRNLKFWRSLNETTNSPMIMNVSALVAVMCAVLCPRFTFAAVNSDYLQSYEERIREYMDHPSFTPYLDRLSRLLLM